MKTEILQYVCQCLRNDFEGADYLNRLLIVQQAKSFELYDLAQEFESDMSFNQGCIQSVNQELETIGCSHRLIA